MGMDVRGILYYGIRLDEEPGSYDDLSDAWADAYEPQKPNHQNYHAPEWDAWRKKNAEFHKSMENISIDWSGSEYDKTFYVHCVGLRKRVEWGEQLKIEPDDLLPNTDVDALLHKFCTQAGLPYSQPAWHLACEWL
jgi:hypothetical protein